MPSQLVADVRALLRAREEEGRPVTMAERALLLATLAPPRRGGEDVVDELERAIVAGRYALSEQYAQHRTDAIKRLLAASRAVLDHTSTIPDPDYDPAGMVLAQAHGGRPMRVDVDG